LKHTNLP